MARRSRMSILKRQRELKKAEKAAAKRARRHGLSPRPEAEPVPTIAAADLVGPRPVADDTAAAETERDKEPS